MSSVNLAAGSESTRSLTSAAKILAPADVCAGRAQLSPETLGGVSSMALAVKLP
jgi:hypothetical protein